MQIEDWKVPIIAFFMIFYRWDVIYHLAFSINQSLSSVFPYSNLLFILPWYLQQSVIYYLAVLLTNSKSGKVEQVYPLFTVSSNYKVYAEHFPL